jgi:hypothetical protein
MSQKNKNKKIKSLTYDEHILEDVRLIITMLGKITI